MYQMALFFRYDTLPPKQITQAQYGELKGYEGPSGRSRRTFPLKCVSFAVIAVASNT